ncbi:hypothetical protein [Mycolicibacterium fallax]|nr:hypothetical protein [Mycolicibacterium fallax]BBY97579.1 hypothetical protein MFAL_10460 [Mycolicibacterium fallax]HOW93652.1 hypothetical protein [Mycolicibacterium fallax]HSA41333.1 hypothetical protein [Mycobacterium sp.]
MSSRSMVPSDGMRWRRAAAAAGAALALVGGALSLAPVAGADVLDELAEQYSTGAGAGQVANLVSTSMNLRTQGYRPRPGDLAAIKAALDKRPNQAPLVAALQNAVAYQAKKQRQLGGDGGAPPVVIGGSPGSINTQAPGGNWVPGNPMIDNDSPFPMPGRS